MPPTPPIRSRVPAAVVAALLVVSVAATGAAVLGSGPAGAVAAATGRPEPGSAAPVTPRPTRPPAAATPAPAFEPPAPTPTPTPTPTPVPVTAMNLYEEGDFVSQATKDQCVSAAMQIMLNIGVAGADTSARTQARLAELATRLSDARDGGTEPIGWALGLDAMGGGAYRVEVAPSRTKALLRAVTAIRLTGRPAGLLVWRGAHSWVLHGFETTADPLGGVPFAVTHLHVSDPWYPRVSSIWGESRGPNARITPAELEEDFLPWRRPTGPYPGMDGQYVVILPIDG